MSANPPTTQSEQPRPFAPASPPDIPSSLSSSKPAFSHAQHPISPPLSTSASHLDASGISSPLASDFTPPTSAPMSAQTSQNPPISFNMSDVQGDMENNSEHKASDNDLSMQENYDESQHLQPNAKRKMEGDDQGKAPNKRRKTEERDLEPANDADLENSNGPSYGPFPGLCENPHPPSRPHVGQNLFKLYNLEDTAAAVARFDPTTGAKTNVILKSYSSKIRDLNGKNKANKAPGDLLNLMRIGDEDWENTQVRGKEIERIGISDDFMARVAKAVQMTPGNLPPAQAQAWNDTLVDAPSTSKRSNSTGPQPSAQKPPATISRPTITTNTTAASKASSPNEMFSPNTVEAMRPKRRGTKRRYNDESFDGYQETFDGATYGDDGDSIDGDDDVSSRRGSGSRKRRKDPSSASSPTSFGKGIGQHSPVTVGPGNYYGGR